MQISYADTLLKLVSEYETEYRRREENLFNWQVDTYEDINTYYSSA